MTQPHKTQRILFTTDLSENARHNFVHAAALAAELNAELIIFHAIPPTPHNVEQRIADMIGHDQWERLKEERELEVRETLAGKRREGQAIRNALGVFTEAAVDRMGVGFKADEIVVGRGPIVEEIIRQARESQVDLIAIGYTEHGIFGKSKGDSAGRIAQKAGVPVVVLPAEKQ